MSKLCLQGTFAARTLCSQVGWEHARAYNRGRRVPKLALSLIGSLLARHFTKSHKLIESHKVEAQGPVRVLVNPDSGEQRESRTCFAELAAIQHVRQALGSEKRGTVQGHPFRITSILRHLSGKARRLDRGSRTIRK